MNRIHQLLLLKFFQSWNCQLQLEDVHRYDASSFLKGERGEHRFHRESPFELTRLIHLFDKELNDHI